MKNRPLDGANHLNWMRSLMKLGQKTLAQQLYLRLEKRAETAPQISPYLKQANRLVEMP
jgi:hypothetical protein